MKTCINGKKNGVCIEGKNIRIEFDELSRSRVTVRLAGAYTVIGAFTYSEYIAVPGGNIKDFAVTGHSSEKVNDELGIGERHTITSNNELLNKEISVVIYNEFPYTAFFRVSYKNTANSALIIKGWTNNHYSISAVPYEDGVKPFWSYQGGSYDERPAWVVPLHKGFHQSNYMGMNTCDYGGGTPVSDIWRRDAGIAVGQAETVPKMVSLPVSMPDDGYAELAVNVDANMELLPGETLSTLETFITVHSGDYFKALSEYRRFMEMKGIKFNKPAKTAYEPTWCAWGYEKDFKVEQIFDNLPKIKEMGIKWVCMDYGWLTLEGDLILDSNKFPGGEKDIKSYVDRLHSEGFKAQLWCIPLAADPKSKLLSEHPEYFILNEKGEHQFITFFDCYYLCPAYNEVKDLTTAWVTKILQDWGFDGLKMDGSNLNAAPPCYNEKHHHAYPEQSFEAVPEFYKMIYETAVSIKPDVFLMFCPCGETYSFFSMPYYNVPVASDPESSWQVRSKGKTFKALMGPSVPYHGDHVELSDGGDDFASTIGIGGVPDTKFTWPDSFAPDPSTHLDAAKEILWKKWFGIYHYKMLSEGIYQGELYSFGYDVPEAHTVKKGESMYYAFYADCWDGEIELRGLKDCIYRIYDYVNKRDYGTVRGPLVRLIVNFNSSLLLQAEPVT